MEQKVRWPMMLAGKDVGRMGWDGLGKKGGKEEPLFLYAPHRIKCSSLWVVGR